MTANDEQLREPPVRPGYRHPIALTLALVVIVALGSVADNRWRSWQAGAPYGADAVHARVSLFLAKPETSQAKIDELAGPGRLVTLANPGGVGPGQSIIGQLQFDVPARAPADGQYALFVIDRRIDKVVPYIEAVGPPGTNVGEGWDGGYDRIARKAPWLRSVAEVRTANGSGWTAPGMSASWSARTHGPVTFAIQLGPAALPVDDPIHQLTVALVFLGSGDRVYWAMNLTPS
jgi:hypothetical protein